MGTAWCRYADELTSSSVADSNYMSSSETPADTSSASFRWPLIFVDETEFIQQRMEARSRSLHGATSSGPDEPELARRSPGLQVAAGERPSAAGSAGAVPPIPPRTYGQKRARMKHRKHSNDGYQWSKYGQKVLSTGSDRLRRHYFRCTFDGCSAKKTTTSKIGADSDDFIPESVRYTGKHTHSLVDLGGDVSGRLVCVKACSPESGPERSRMDTFQLPAEQASE